MKSDTIAQYGWFSQVQVEHSLSMVSIVYWSSEKLSSQSLVCGSIRLNPYF
jgi:hypothetical protein